MSVCPVSHSEAHSETHSNIVHHIYNTFTTYHPFHHHSITPFAFTHFHCRLCRLCCRPRHDVLEVLLVGPRPWRLPAESISLGEIRGETSKDLQIVFFVSILFHLQMRKLRMSYIGHQLHLIQDIILSRHLHRRKWKKAQKSSKTIVEEDLFSENHSGNGWSQIWSHLHGVHSNI